MQNLKLFLMILGTLLSACTLSQSQQASSDLTSETQKIAKSSSCRTLPTTPAPIFDSKDERLIEVISTQQDANGMAEIIKLADQVIVAGRIIGRLDEHHTIRFDWERIPNGGVARSPMYRLANFILNLPTKNNAVIKATESMGERALQIAEKEGLGRGTGFHTSMCGNKKCEFTWKRASDGSLSMTAIYFGK